MQNDSNPMLLMVDLTNESFLSVWSVVIAMYVYIALFLTSDLDYLVAIRTSSYISYTSSYYTYIVSLGFIYKQLQ